MLSQNYMLVGWWLSSLSVLFPQKCCQTPLFDRSMSERLCHNTIFTANHSCMITFDWSSCKSLILSQMYWFSYIILCREILKCWFNRSCHMLPDTDTNHNYTGPQKKYNVLGLRPGYSYVFWGDDYECNVKIAPSWARFSSRLRKWIKIRENIICHWYAYYLFSYVIFCKRWNSLTWATDSAS